MGEGLTLEFKTRVPKAERISKEVIAFANTSGGRLLLGVDDDGGIKGVRDAEEEEYALTAALEKHCRPPVKISTERIPISNKRNVILVRVPASSEKPHKLVAENGEETVYIRVADMSVEASREHVRLMKNRNKADNVVFEFGEKEKVLMRYLENYGRITVAQFARVADIPKRRASHTLVLLAKANVLQLHPDSKTDYFTLAYAG